MKYDPRLTELSLTSFNLRCPAIHEMIAFDLGNISQAIILPH